MQVVRASWNFFLYPCLRNFMYILHKFSAPYIYWRV